MKTAPMKKQTLGFTSPGKHQSELFLSRLRHLDGAAAAALAKHRDKTGQGYQEV
jgi:hypothetical protein